MKIIKRLAIGLLAGLLLAMAGCSKKGTDSRTLDHFTKAFEDAGHSVADATEPLFAAVGATAGTMFKIGDETVKIYMYESEEALEKATTPPPSRISNATAVSCWRPPTRRPRTFSTRWKKRNKPKARKPKRPPRFCLYSPPNRRGLFFHWFMNRS